MNFTAGLVAGIILAATAAEQRQIPDLRMRPLNELITWQWIDSAFPGGGFAHSAGLEAAWQQKAIGDSQDLANFILAGLGQAAHFSLPVVLATAHEPSDWVRVDEHYDALLNNHVANRASRLQGRAMLAAAARAFERRRLTGIQAELREQKLPGHHASLFGAVAAALELSAARAAELFAFQSLRGWISAAVRLGIVGPLEGQSLQAQLLPHVDRAVRLAQATPLEEIAQTAVLPDILHANQDRLYSRLFQS